MTIRARNAIFHEAERDRPGHYLVAGDPSKCLVLIHGISRNAAEIVYRFAAAPAFREHTLIAPLFTAERNGRYQQMRARPGQSRSDRALGDLVGHLTARGIMTAARFDLFGFSGGAQMAHRFALFHPLCVRALLAVAAGWYTMPDQASPYPHGLARGVVDAEPRLFLDVRTTVAVGSLDRRRDATLNRSALLDREQGATRLERAHRWVDAMNRLALGHGRSNAVRLVIMSGGTHDFGQCVREAGLLDIAVYALGDLCCESRQPLHSSSFNRVESVG